MTISAETGQILEAQIPHEAADDCIETVPRLLLPDELSESAIAAWSGLVGRNAGRLKADYLAFCEYTASSGIQILSNSRSDQRA